MARKLIACSLVTLLFTISSCTRPSANAPDGGTAGAYLSAPGSVGFDIASLNDQNGTLRLLATYPSRGKLAKFIIEFGPATKVGGSDSEMFPVESGKGRFLAEPESDASVLLLDLQKALEAKAVPPKVRRAKSLPFTFVNIGDNLSQAPGGGFDAKPSGGWSVIKIFIGEGQQETEVFVNLNREIAKGQFSIKDPEYGDRVLKQLATVL